MVWLWWTLGIGGGLFALMLIVGQLLLQYDERRKRRVLREGEHTTGWLVQANVALFKPGTADQPALVLISPDRETAQNKDFMLALAERVFSLKGHDPADCVDEEDAFVAALMADEAYIEGKKDQLPERFAEGHAVYLTNIMIFRDDLPGKKLSGRRVPCAVLWADDKLPVVSRPLTAREFSRPAEDEDY